MSSWAARAEFGVVYGESLAAATFLDFPLHAILELKICQQNVRWWMVELGRTGRVSVDKSPAVLYFKLNTNEVTCEAEGEKKRVSIHYHQNY